MRELVVRLEDFYKFDHMLGGSLPSLNKAW